MQNLNEPNQIPERLGLVISYFGNSVAVRAEDGQVFQCHLRRNQELPVVGDEVRWQLDSAETGTIISILPRRSQLTRAHGHSGTKPIAANVDSMVIVMAPPPIFSEHLVDRYLMAAELLNIKPVIVINKADLLTDETKAPTEKRLMPYAGVPYTVIYSTIYKESGLASLKEELKGKTAVLVGPSGVGKSSIISALSGDASIRTNVVSPKGAGKHTTTATTLYELPEGIRLIDSPGVREFSLWPITKPEVLKGFPEFKPYLTGCKFRDCQHVAEPGCAVQEAVASGKISPERYASFQAFMKEAHTNKNY